MSDTDQPALPPPTITPGHATTAELAAFFGVTDVNIAQLAKRGVVIKVAHGKYDRAASVKAYIRYLQGRAQGRGTEDVGADSYETHRARLYKARADRAEIDLWLKTAGDDEVRAWGKTSEEIRAEAERLIDDHEARARSLFRRFWKLVRGSS